MTRVYARNKAGKVVKYDVQTSDRAAAVEAVRHELGSKYRGPVLVRVK